MTLNEHERPAIEKLRKELERKLFLAKTSIHAQSEKGKLTNETVQAVWQAESNVRHFKTLLEWNLTGKPLKEEVVV